MPKSQTIPISGQASWQEIYAVPIADNGEALVPLSLTPEQLLVRSAYFEAGLTGALPECYAREAVLDRLLVAASLLPRHLRLVVLDGWRSKQVQMLLFEHCRDALAQAYPNADEARLTRMAEQYVAPQPKGAIASSPHATGGALDVTLASRDGKCLFFGAPFDFPGEISFTRYFEERLALNISLSDEEQCALENRRLLYRVMIAAGFVNYSSEWWHYEYGTQRWAHDGQHKTAIYGPKQLSLAPFSNLGQGDNP